jgi:hypothetical protein
MALATGYVQTFDGKWVHARRPEARRSWIVRIFGLADLGNSFAIVREMRVAPSTRHTHGLALAAALPWFLCHPWDAGRSAIEPS